MIESTPTVLQVWKCGECCRLAVFERPDDPHTPVWYAKEPIEVATVRQAVVDELALWTACPGETTALRNVLARIDELQKRAEGIMAGERTRHP